MMKKSQKKTKRENDKDRLPKKQRGLFCERHLSACLTSALTISMIYAKRIYDEEKSKENKA